MLASLMTNNDGGLHKVNEKFERSLLNETNKFCAYYSQLKVK